MRVTKHLLSSVILGMSGRSLLPLLYQAVVQAVKQLWEQAVGLLEELIVRNGFSHLLLALVLTLGIPPLVVLQLRLVAMALHQLLILGREYVPDVLFLSLLVSCLSYRLLGCEILAESVDLGDGLGSELISPLLDMVRRPRSLVQLRKHILNARVLMEHGRFTH